MTSASHAWGRLSEWLPHGRSLPDDVWRRRHTGMTILLWAHVPALFLFALAYGNSPQHSLVEIVPIGICALLAMIPALGRRGRAAAVTVGLLTCSAVLVHLWNGTIEAHFHYFVMLCVLALYEEWFPYLLAIAFIVLQHGIMGTMEPHSVYSRAEGDQQSPWIWAAVHGGFVAAVGLASIISWRSNEAVREQLRRHQEQLAYQASHDPLTELPNRTRFTERLGEAVARTAETGHQVAVVFVDVDNFKVINDSLGHASGDELLRAVADRLKRVLRPDDVLSRFGGDEFTACVERITDERHALRIADRMATALRAPFVVDGEPRYVTASFGITLTRDPEADATALLRDADAAMYRAKERGKARCELFDSSMRDRALERLELESGLQHALERAELRIEYQPEVALATGRIVAVEALLRWDHPVHGPISPARFIPIAEQSGLIVPIGAWVLREACRQVASWTEATGEGLVVAVNLSPRQLGASDLRTIVQQAIDDAGLPPERLCLEITESAVMADPDSAIATLRMLKDLGVRLAIDDFGVGYSSLGHLRHLLPVDVLKIDRSFVDGLADRAEDLAIVGAVVELARSLGLSAVAEGVETGEQADALRALACDVGQGFHFARPQRPEQVRQLLGVHTLGELTA